MSERPTVAVLGASGFVGTRLIEWLVLRDLAQVRPIVRSYRSLARVARFDLDWRLADARDPVALERAYRAAARAGVRRLVYVSSAVVHGLAPAPGTHDESPLLAKQPFAYNVSKVLAEERLRRLRADGAVEVVTLRPMIVFGPRSRWWSAQIAGDLLAGQACLLDGGEGICNTIYVDNLVHAMWQAAWAPGAANQDFLVADGERVTWRDLYAAVAEAIGVAVDAVPSVPSATLPKLLSAQRRAALRAAGRRFAWALGETLQATVVQTAREVLPSRLLDLLKPRWGALRALGAVSADTGAAGRPALVVDREMAALQSCRAVLPVDKARRLLGYAPPVPFAEGSRRTGAWLRFVFGLD
ncbi:MAG: NAD-dependent epimerase/dehydratase family protein [Chloroflexi bacterium]|nr:NAD-dependent epimerase/dehydratase family protein [Chloroflexota bacterium]